MAVVCCKIPLTALREILDPSRVSRKGGVGWGNAGGQRRLRGRPCLDVVWFAKAWLADVWQRFGHRKMIDLFNFLQDDDFPILPRFLVGGSDAVIHVAAGVEVCKALTMGSNRANRAAETG